MGCITQRSKSLKEGDSDNTNVMSIKKKIVLAGLHGSGKTSIFQRIKHNTFINEETTTTTSSSSSSSSQIQSQKYSPQSKCQFESQSSCCGLKIEQIAIRDDLEFLIYDINGLNDKLMYENLSDADGVLFVIDSCDRSRLWRVKEELTRISQEMRYSESVVLVLFNKQDEENSIDINTLLQETGVHSELDLDVFIQPCSAKSGKGFKEAFDKLTHYFLRDQEKNEF